MRADGFAELLARLGVVECNGIGALCELHRQQTKQRAVDCPTGLQYLRSAACREYHVLHRHAAAIKHRLTQHALTQTDGIDLACLEWRHCALQHHLDHLVARLPFAAIKASHQHHVTGRDIGDPHLAPAER